MYKGGSGPCLEGRGGEIEETAVVRKSVWERTRTVRIQA